jgi:hypothetical protein
MDAPALAAAIGGPVVGLAGVMFGWFNASGERAQGARLARDQREHERVLAREARLGSELRAAYEELLRLVFVVEDIINRTNPIIAPGPAPPSMPPEEELRKTIARASVIGSEEVMKAVEALWTAQRAFWINSQTLDSVQQQGGGTNVGDLFRQVQEARDAFRERARELERMIRAEVRA